MFIEEILIKRIINKLHRYLHYILNIYKVNLFLFKRLYLFKLVVRYCVMQYSKFRVKLCYSIFYWRQISLMLAWELGSFSLVDFVSRAECVYGNVVV